MPLDPPLAWRLLLTPHSLPRTPSLTGLEKEVDMGETKTGHATQLFGT